MKNFITIKAFLFCSLNLIISSCRSDDKYREFASAGQNYYVAVDNLLKCAGNVTIDASSINLLEPYINHYSDKVKPSKVQLLQQYSKQQQTDRNFLRVLQLLREQNSLQKRYFDELYALATVNTNNALASKVGDTVGNIASNLNTINTKITDTQDSQFKIAPDAFKGISNIAISSKISGVLRTRLEADKTIIEKTLAIQKLMVNSKIIPFSIGNLEQLETSQLALYNRRPYIESTLKPEQLLSKNFNDIEWVKQRYQYLSIEKLIANLGSIANLNEGGDANSFSNTAAASDSSIVGELQKIFNDLLTNKANIEEIKQLQSNLKSNNDVFVGLCNYNAYYQVSQKRNKYRMSGTRVPDWHVN